MIIFITNRSILDVVAVLDPPLLSFSAPYSPAFGPNTEIDSVSHGRIGTRKTPQIRTIFALKVERHLSNLKHDNYCISQKINHIDIE